MRQSHLPPAVLAAVLSACATESVALNSDRIEKRFGSYGIDLLASEAGLRRSNLFSLEGGTAICRTYAVVQFVEQLDERYDDAHARVLAGNPIGETFREDGWEVRKSTAYIGAVRLPDRPTEVAALMRLSAPRDLALHVYRLGLAREDVLLEYATIVEVHHPDYLTAGQLRELFEDDGARSLADEDIARLASLVFAPADGRKFIAWPGGGREA